MNRMVAVSSIGLSVMAAFADLTIEQLPGGGSALKVSGSEFSNAESAALNNNEVSELWKIGAGTLLSRGISEFSGIVRVKEGILEVSDETGLGDKNGESFVEDGATLKFNLINGGYYWYPGETLHVCGSGFEQKGAIYVSAGDTYLGRLVLSDDTLVTSDVSFHFFEEPIVMNGKTLTIDLNDSARTLQFRPQTVTSPGHLVMERGILRIEGSMDGDDSNTITLKSAAQMMVVGSICPWKAILTNDVPGVNARLWFVKDEEPRELSYEGPIEYQDGFDGITGSWTTGEWGYMRMAFNGSISGVGSFCSRYQWDPRKGDHFIEFNNTNTFTGTLYVKDCTALRAKYPESIPDITKVSFGPQVDNYNQLVLDLATDDNPAGWTGTALSDALKYYNRTDFPDARVYVGAKEGDVGVATGLVFGATKQIVLGAIGPGSVKVEAKFESDDLLVVTPKSPIALSAPVGNSWEGAFTTFRVKDGELIFEGAGFVPFGSASWTVSSHPKWDGTAHLTVGEGSVLSCDYPALGGTPTTGLTIGEAGDGHDGIVEVRGGAMTNSLRLATRALSAGALYVNSGEFFSPGKWGDPTAIGKNIQSGHGYVEVNGGCLTSFGACHIGCRLMENVGAPSGAKGIFYQTGGTVRLLPSDNYGEILEIGAGGTGVVYQTGGMIDVANTKHLIINGSSYGGSYAAANAGKGVLTLDGATAHLVAKRIVMGERKGESILNVLNGATLETGYVFHNKYQIYVESYGDEYRHVEGEITGDMEYVNFDGGVFKYLERDVVPRECSDDLFGNTFRSDDGNTRPKFVTVYSGGMTVDTAGADKMFSAPLLKPKSGGVMALSLPGGASHLDGYITAPFVDIKGTGQGATAVAIFDSATRRVTGVKVTSPGWGYAQGSTIATLSQCGQRPVDAVVLDVTVGDPAQTGGFTKRGAGNLTLTAANEILGPVSVEGGTLTIAKGASIDSTAPVSIGADAALSVEHGAVYAPEFVSGAGRVSGLSSVSVGADWNLKATDLVAGKHLTSSGELKLTAGGAVHVDDVAALGRKSRVIAEAAGGIVGALPTLGAEFDASEWEVSSDGRRLILHFMRGLVISIR